MSMSGMLNEVPAPPSSDSHFTFLVNVGEHMMRLTAKKKVSTKAFGKAIVSKALSYHNSKFATEDAVAEVRLLDGSVIEDLSVSTSAVVASYPQNGAGIYEIWIVLQSTVSPAV